MIALYPAPSEPDPRKGEQLVLFTTQADALAPALQAWGRANGIAELSIPKDVRVVAALPVLGTGKIDYVTMAEQAQQPAAKPQDEVEEADA